MQPQAPDQKKLLTEVIKKQIIILGPDITLAKARNVPGLTVADDGSVISMVGDPQQLTQKLIEQFMELSGLIVKKTMEPLLAMNQGISPVLPPIPIVVPPIVQTPTQTQPAQNPAQPTLGNSV